jgi:hypothetical protein
MVIFEGMLNVNDSTESSSEAEMKETLDLLFTGINKEEEGSS